MHNQLKEIPFKQGSTATMLLAVCALFMFLTFLSYSFHHLFSPTASLRQAAEKPGYVLMLPKTDIEAIKIHQDSMGFLDHMLSYIDDVIGHKEFVMKDYSSVLPLFMAEDKENPYVEIRLARESHLNDIQFRQDLDGIIPDVKVYTRSEFFTPWVSKLERVSQICYAISFMMFFALCISVIVLITGCFKLHRKTIQTLRFLGASQVYITKKFQSFFSKHFLIGSAIGLFIALFIFVPIAWIVDPTLQMSSLLIQEMVQLLTMGTAGYVFLFIIMKGLLMAQARKLV